MVTYMNRNPASECQHCHKDVEYVTFPDWTKGFRHVGDVAHLSANTIPTECPTR